MDIVRRGLAVKMIMPDLVGLIKGETRLYRTIQQIGKADVVDVVGVNLRQHRVAAQAEVIHIGALRQTAGIDLVDEIPAQNAPVIFEGLHNAPHVALVVIQDLSRVIGI